METGIIGSSVWQQNMALLERLTIDRANRDEKLKELKKLLEVDEMLYLATCNRVEFMYVTSGNVHGASLLHRLIDFFFKNQETIDFFPNDFYHFRGKEAITHLFRTTSSLESMVMGENQIAGQVKEAHKDSMTLNITGPQLDRLIREALTVARKVKGQTSLGKGSLSMASLASRELTKALNKTKNPHIAIVGSGPMQTKLARYVKDNLSASLLFVSRSIENAKKLAGEFGGDATALDYFKDNPGNMDAIISSTAAIDPIFDKIFLNKLTHCAKPIVCVDLAVPRDFSTDFIGHKSIQLIDIPFLKSQGQGNLRQKFLEAGKANEIVRKAVESYLSDGVEISLRPIFRSSYEESMELAHEAMRDLFNNRVTNLDKDDQQAVLKVVAKLIGHSSFNPIRKLSSSLAEKSGAINIPETDSLHQEAV
jgi:glutamyl-tRNA reductase